MIHKRRWENKLTRRDGEEPRGEGDGANKQEDGERQGKVTQDRDENRDKEKAVREKAKDKTARGGSVCIPTKLGIFFSGKVRLGTRQETPNQLLAESLREPSLSPRAGSSTPPASSTAPPPQGSGLHLSPSGTGSTRLLRVWASGSGPAPVVPRSGLPPRPPTSSPRAGALGDPAAGPSAAQPGSMGIRRWAMLPPAGRSWEAQRAWRAGVRPLRVGIRPSQPVPPPRGLSWNPDGPAPPRPCSPSFRYSRPLKNQGASV